MTNRRNLKIDPLLNTVDNNAFVGNKVIDFPVTKLSLTSSWMIGEGQ